MKFVSKIKNLINRIFKVFLALIPNKYLRAKLKADWTKFFIKKYTDIAVKNYEENKKQTNNNPMACFIPELPLPPVFQFWEQGIENAPLMVKTCVDSIKKFEPDLKHIVLDYKSIEDYVEIPSYIYDLKNKGKIKSAQFSDILRSCLLGTRPCLWVDSTVLFTGKLPDYIKERDFFMFKGVSKTPEQFAGANYFIFSKAVNPLLAELKDAILEYWKDNDFLVSYFTHPHYISLLAKQNKELWNKIPVVDERLTLQFSQILFDKFDESNFNSIISNFPIHKLSYKIPENLKINLKDTYYTKIEEKFNA